jgi:hypothetical protein
MFVIDGLTVVTPAGLIVDLLLLDGMEVTVGVIVIVSNSNMIPPSSANHTTG